MYTHNEIRVRAPLSLCFRAATEVERWPEILSHYRQVVFLRRDGPGSGRVRMAARRTFGPFPYPVWWESEMRSDPERSEVHYRHVAGITRGMDVVWRLRPDGPDTRIEIVHEWEGPGWPLLGGLAARRVIGPHFVHVVAGRTLEGIRRHLESAVGSRPPAPPPGDLAAASAGESEAPSRTDSADG